MRVRPVLLIVDDSKTVRMIARKAFRGFECEVLEAGNGVEGLALACSRMPALIFLDITMPVMGGVETLGRLKSDSELAPIPVVILLSEGDRDVVPANAQGVLAKPLKREALIEVAVRVVGLRLKGPPVAA